MKVVILAGGFGSRLGELTELIPKPMVLVGERPLLWHIMQNYASCGFNEFILSLGYRADVIKDYFINYKIRNSDLTVNMKNGAIEFQDASIENWLVTLVDTGLNTQTGGRIKALKKYIGDKTFMVTYGDGVSDVNIDELIKFHRKHGKMATVTAVHPSARFGELVTRDNVVTEFKEKPQITQGWVNGGYFVFEPNFLDYISDDPSAVLEAGPLELAATHGELMSYYHNGFWKCVDTKRDLEMLNDMCEKNATPWIR